MKKIAERYTSIDDWGRYSVGIILLSRNNIIVIYIERL